MTPARRYRVNTTTIWAAVGAALLVHAALLGTVDAWGLSMVSGGLAADQQKDLTAAAEPPPEPELKTTCGGDVLLATGARAAMCLAPWNADVDGCGSDTIMTMWMDLSSCQAGEAIATAPISLINPRQAEKVTPIDPEQLLDEAMQQQLAMQQPPPPPPPPQQPQAQPPPPPPPPPPKPAQVVETAKPNTEKEPENARFLSENNVSVDKQKVARGSVQEPMVAKSKDADLTAKQNPKEASVKEIKDQDKGKNEKAPEVPGTLAMRPAGTPQPSDAPQEQKTRGSVLGAKGPLVADGFVPRHGDGAIESSKRDQGELSRGQSGAGGGVPQVPNLKPTTETLERAIGGGSVDHLEDVENGDETALSAKRWVYASFFNRLKRQVAQNWDPATVWRRSDPQGTVHGFKTRVTEVRVSLSGKGELQKIVVTAPSGVGELDDEAVRAFHASAPFPNPPDGLVQKDGLITFAFSFYFEIGAPRSSWRVIRSQ
ncbi:MAG: TonB C-terminal domain-containing protein [Deltaproteobacteria bacterium]|nr:TonB C-terminal domain-containing protein [Deltaproteobacteria bacterium]